MHSKSKYAEDSLESMMEEDFMEEELEEDKQTSSTGLLHTLANQPSYVLRRLFEFVNQDDNLTEKFYDFLKQEQHQLLQKRLSDCPSFLSLDRQMALKILKMPFSELAHIAIMLRKIKTCIPDSEWMHIMDLASIESVLKS